jgi:hypothetical protein
MCWMMLATTALTAGTAAIQAKQQKAAGNANAAVQASQLRVQMQEEKIRATAELNARLREYLSVQATNRANLSASGLQQNISYDTAIAPENRRVARTDMARTMFDSNMRRASSAYRVSVANWTADTGGRTAWLDAGLKVAGFVGENAMKGNYKKGMT